MGVYLAQPNKTKKINSGESAQTNLKFFSCQMQGWRRQMEDACICQPNLEDGNSLFAVFDGHGGPEVSQFVKQNFLKALLECEFYKKGAYPEALASTFYKIDELIKSRSGENRLKQIYEERMKNQSEVVELEKKRKRKPSGSSLMTLDPKEIKMEKRERRNSENICQQRQFELKSPTINKNKFQNSNAKIAEKVGCTANVVLISNNKIYVANTGDSRSILSRNNKGYALSFDHKPTNPAEYQRITKCGWKVTNGRINGGINVSRTLGDFSYKNIEGMSKNQQPVICLPEVRCIDKSSEDQFLLVGCDGVFEKYYNEEQKLIDFIRKGRKNRKSGTQILVNLFEKSIAQNTNEHVGCDNMTAILLEFH